MATLRLVPVSGHPIEVTRDRSVVGRDPGCDILVTDGSVSRKHAQLELRSGIWYVVDQGSANGTYVNSLRVAESALKNGQELRFGALAFRVDIVEDPEATVASPILPVETDTVMAPSIPAATPGGAPPLPPSAGSPPPPPPRAASAPPPPPPPPSRGPDRFRPAGGSPVPPMAGGPPPPRKGRGPVFWVVIGCCGCLLVAGLLAALGVGGAWFMTKGAADAAHAWLADVRTGGMDEATRGLSAEYRSRLSEGELADVVAAIQESTDATLPGRQVENDRAVLTGVLTGADAPRPIVIRLVKEGGGWRVDDVRLKDGFGTLEE